MSTRRVAMCAGHILDELVTALLAFCQHLSGGPGDQSRAGCYGSQATCALPGGATMVSVVSAALLPVPSLPLLFEPMHHTEPSL